MPRLFVIMPFGVRELPTDGAPLDFDAVYDDLIRPAAQEAGWEPHRIDELAQPGVITDQYLRELYAADLVLADVSMPNGNVYYELGVRQAISAAGTLLIALEGTELPFDLSTQRVLFYGGDFSRDSGPRLRLAAALRSFDPTATTNPVRTFLERMGLTSSPRHDDAAFEQDLNGRINRARNADQLVAVWHWAKAFRPLPASALLALADHLADYRVYATAADVLRAAVRSAPGDYEVHRKLGFYLRQLGPEHEEAAMEHLSRARELNPDDPETLGIIGGLLKRQGRYVDAHQQYELGAKLSPANLYMRVNQACMAVLADVRSPQRGVELYQQLLTFISNDPNLTEDSWAALVSGEACFAIGELDSAHQYFTAAVQFGARSWHIRSAADQVELLGRAGFRTAEADRLAAVLRELAKDVESGVTGTRASQARVTPAPVERSRAVVFHLSDLHFGWIRRDGRRIDTHRFYDSENSRRLSLELIDEFRRHIRDRGMGPNNVLVVVSGDLTYTASEEEFRLVERFLGELCDGVGIERGRTLLVPGNHDVDWDQARIDKSKRFDNYLAFLDRYYGRDLFGARYPLIDWDFTIHSQRPPANRIVALWSDGMMVAVGLNSCVFETEQHHYGFIGLRQLDYVAGLLQRPEVRDSTTEIAVLHHHRGIVKFCGSPVRA